ncbi:hypothetical protein [Plasticicumulans sp.]|uniref:hypothetical protein n=1 Tax=Plasticicumulans sp. TaxID=2307179 RepID=UPI0039585E4F
MQSIRQFRRFVVSGLALALVFTAGVVTGAQPHMVNALGALQTAKSELQAAQANKGGHRLKAIDLVNQAISEVQAGMEAAGG